MFGVLTTFDVASGSVEVRRVAKGGGKGEGAITELCRNVLTDRLAAARGAMIYLWDARVPSLSGVLSAPNQDLHLGRLQYSGADRLVACTQKHAYVWDLRRLDIPLFQHPTAEGEMFTSIAADQMTPNVVLCQSSGVPIVFNTSRGLVERVLPYLGSAATCADVVDGCVAVGGHDGEVLLSRACGASKTIYKHAAKVNSVRISHGKVIASSSDGSVSMCPTVFDAPPFSLRTSSLRENAANKPHPSRPAVSHASYDGSQLVATCDSVVRVYNF